MAGDPKVEKVAASLQASMGMLVRRLRQTQVGGELTLPENSALARLDRCGPTTASVLAKLEQISPQSMGATLGALEARGLIERRPDPADGRQALVSVTKSGLRARRDRRSATMDQLARAIATTCTAHEIDQLIATVPLIERLAESI